MKKFALYDRGIGFHISRFGVYNRSALDSTPGLREADGVIMRDSGAYYGTVIDEFDHNDEAYQALAFYRAVSHVHES